MGLTIWEGEWGNCSSKLCFTDENIFILPKKFDIGDEIYSISWSCSYSVHIKIFRDPNCGASRKFDLHKSP